MFRDTRKNVTPAVCQHPGAWHREQDLQMQIHRTEHLRHFSVLPNSLLQDRRLSFTARGLLADLLSRPDGWREDGRHMADTSTQGRGTVRKALKELTAAGYYRVDVVRLPDGTFRSETHVHDTPQLSAPDVTRPASGGGTTGRPDAPSKNPDKEPTLPAEPPVAPSEELRSAITTLYRVIRPEPRLRLGEAEATALAPLVARWLERGSTPQELAHALLPDLPATVHAPAGLLRNRLERKMPPPAAPAGHHGPRYSVCSECRDPVPQRGLCGPCAGLGVRPVAVGGGAAATRRGAALVRAAMNGARSALGGHGPAPVGVG